MADIPELAQRRIPRIERVEDDLVDLFVGEGFLHLGVAELAQRLSCSKSTLYAIAPSKEQLVTAVVRAFFKRATTRVEERIAAASEPVERIGHYLVAISDEFAPTSSAFFRDIYRFEPARAIYQTNTRAAARRVQEFFSDASRLPGAIGLNASFVGAVAGHVMEAIHRGDIVLSTGLDEAAAYRALADLIMICVHGQNDRTGGGTLLGSPTTSASCTRSCAAE